MYRGVMNDNALHCVGSNAVQDVTGSADGHSNEQTAVICPLHQAKPRQETRSVGQYVSGSEMESGFYQLVLNFKFSTSSLKCEILTFLLLSVSLL